MEEWRAKLAAGEAEAAWGQFIARYQRLIVATIRRTVGNEDDVADVFSDFCAALVEDNLDLLKRHSDTGKARFSTWLVTVVHRRTIDWIRHREGRRRLTLPDGLSSVQKRIFEHIFVDRRSHVEGYELMHQRTDPEMSFGDYLKEVAETYRVMALTGGRTMNRFSPSSSPQTTEMEPDVEEKIVSVEASARVATVLAKLPADERLAIKLFVIDELPAERVARVVGWKNAKAVYNRVYRALSMLRKELEEGGIEPPGR